MDFWPIVQRFFQTQDIKKFSWPSSIIMPIFNKLRFINNFNFFSTPEEKNRDESGAELVRDGPMVSLGKMMFINRPFRIHVVRSNLNTSKLPRLSLTDITS
jgi:hypothetical protein